MNPANHSSINPAPAGAHNSNTINNAQDSSFSGRSVATTTVDRALIYTTVGQALHNCGYSYEIISRAIAILQSTNPDSELSVEGLLDIIISNNLTDTPASSEARSCDQAPLTAQASSAATSQPAKQEITETEIKNTHGEDTESEVILDCALCKTRPKNIYFLPCNHITCCSVCSSRLKKCPMCRAKITGAISA